MFWAPPRPSSGAATTAVAASGFNLERVGSSIVGRGLPPHSKVKPEAVNPYPANVENKVSS
jgi:hypothetical protein